MRDIRKAPTWDEIRWNPRFNRLSHNHQVEMLRRFQRDAGAFVRFFEMIEAEALRRVRMTKKTANAFQSSKEHVLYAVYLELKERFEEEDE